MRFFVISVIIPTFNRVNELSRAIESVWNQTTYPLELIIVDDGSSDHTKSFVKNIKDRSPVDIQYLKTNRLGVSGARNRGIQVAKGEWIALLDSDDEWLPTKLESQIELINKNSVLIHTEEIWVRNGKRVNQKKKHQKKGGRIFKESLPLCCISPSSSLIKKDILLKHKGFREDFEVCEDYDLWLKITSEFDVQYIEEAQIIKYGGHEDQLSRKYHSMDIWRVVALYDIFNSKNLSQEEKELTLKEIKYKLKVLEIGYQKRKKLDELHQLLKERKIDFHSM